MQQKKNVHTLSMSNELFLRQDYRVNFNVDNETNNISYIVYDILFGKFKQINQAPSNHSQYFVTTLEK